MSRKRQKAKPLRQTLNQRRQRPPAPWSFDRISRRASEKTQRRLHGNRRQRNVNERSVWAAIAMESGGEGWSTELSWGTRFLRWMIGLLLLPIAWITTWTLLQSFSVATLERGLWQSSQFWYFSVGVLLMTGWFFSKILQPFFLYLYVFGHELTHAFFVKCFGGKVIEVSWGVSGGYVTTDKSNWVIALSPYFVPFWSLVVVGIYVITGLFIELPSASHLTFYALLGASWAFHLVWTLWMIPQDQPDLTETGTFLSLILIYVGNLMVLAGLLCAASPHPWLSLQDFGMNWMGHCITWADIFFQIMSQIGEKIIRKI